MFDKTYTSKFVFIIELFGFRSKQLAKFSTPIVFKKIVMLFEKTKQHADIMFWVNSYKYFPCGKVKKYKATISTRLWPDNAASPDSDESNRSNVRASGHSVR